MSIKGSLPQLKAVQFSRKCLIVSSPGRVYYIAFWLKVAPLLWSMHVPVTSFSLVAIRGISLAFQIVCITGCRRLKGGQSRGQHDLVRGFPEPVKSFITFVILSQILCSKVQNPPHIFSAQECVKFFPEFAVVSQITSNN